MLNGTFNVDDVNNLIHILQSYGISYLLGTYSPALEQHEIVNPVHLIQRLVACNYPIVENACISLFLLHPELGPSIKIALHESEHELAENIAVVVLVTLYLQQWWLFRLAFALGKLPSFPEEPFTSLWKERSLPPPASGYGLHGLLALQDYQQRRYGVPLNFLDDWQNQIDHLLAQEEMYQRDISYELRNALLQYAA